MDLSKKNTMILVDIVRATKDKDRQYLMLSKYDSVFLRDNKMAEINESITEEYDGKTLFATRATQKGIDYLKSLETTEPPTPKETKPMNFELEDGIAVPAARRGRSGQSKYPFDQMEVGQSFHVAPTEERPKPATAIASTVSSATKRFYERDTLGNIVKDDNGKPIKTREFIVRAVGSDDPKGEGARVFRVK